ncbi:N-acetylmuramoyl-L-alanine amidase [Paenibacillus pini]|uniref:N-acetylmuramoyl-L-alanine amidase n=1 Tax=Paenibacillus pini JCM 16418 TaxID=1236976 RepID=W7YNF0_9BACL|nr:N-acetylmuramoyl-L-alanine amidase [Paenibacillus pini]GAF09972.1 N-acetylmuramoyl-L-alanine amidase [Paenibacillus pini JCM 16418]
MEAESDKISAYVVSSELLKSFEAAAKQYKVPVDLLLSIGWNESRLNNYDGKPNADNGFGMMNLVSNSTKTTLELASQITGIEIDKLKTDAESNINGAAAVIAQYQMELNPQLSESPTVSDWSNAIKKYFQSPNEELNNSYLEVVIGTLELINRNDNRVTIEDRILISPLAGLPVVTKIWKPAHSTNFETANRGRGSITSLVIHMMEGTYLGSISWAQQQHTGPSAAHYYVRSSDGEITHMVKDKDIAYHARSANSYTIGIEHEGKISEPAWLTTSMYNSSAKLAAELCYSYGIPVDRAHIKGHSEYPDQTHTDPGQYWDWTLYMRYVQSWYAEYVRYGN